MGRNTKTELQKCLRHNTALYRLLDARDKEIEDLVKVLREATATMIDAADPNVPKTEK